MSDPGYFCCFDQLHRWNAISTFLLGFVFNFTLVWLVLCKTPKEMLVHSRILLQTCVVDILILLQTSVGQPVLSIQPDGNCVLLYYGIFFELPKNPYFMAIFFAIWFTLYNLEVNGICVQFLYRFCMLNCNIKITLARYLLMLSVPFLAISTLAVGWGLMVWPSLTKANKFDANYFANFMPLQAAQKQSSLTYSFDPIGLSFVIWNYGFDAVQIISYTTVIFCAVKMVRFVNAYTGFNARLKELNRQLSRNLIILAFFPLSIISLNLFIQQIMPKLASDNANGMYFLALLNMSFGLLTHWLPVLNPLASIITIKPYREALFQKRQIHPSATGGGGGQQNAQNQTINLFTKSKHIQTGGTPNSP